MDTSVQSEVSLDDQLKLANIEKTKVESEKLKRELERAPRKERKDYWVDIAKFVGGVILGLGGLVAAVTQYEVGEMRAKAARGELDKAVKERAEADAAASAARIDLDKTVKEKTIAIDARNAALKEHADLEQSNQQLRDRLAKTDHALEAAQPQAVRPRLTYVQFKGSLTREFINDLRDHLKTDSFDAPGAARVAGDWKTEVKYFAPDDKAAAEKLANSVSSFLTSKHCPIPTPVSVTLAKAKQGETPPLEVWLSGSCG